ncbi:MAG: ATP-binding protein, partial [Rubricoccaceae bacterium]
MPSHPAFFATPRARHLAVFTAGALLLALLLPATWAVEAWWVSRTTADARAPELAQQRLREAVEAELAAVLAAMRETAERVAAEPAVARALADSLAPSVPERAGGDAVRAVAGRSPAQTAIEVYTPQGLLIAWDGFSLPLRTSAIPDSFRTLTALDGAERRALVVWQPVRDASGAHLGSVRVVRLAQAAVPVRNRYLQDYDLADAWREDLGPSFSVLFVPRPTPPAPDATPLYGPDGTLLGWARVSQPSAAALTDGARRAVRAVQAFWVVLLLGWLFVGQTVWLAREVRRAERRGRRRAWLRSGAVLAGWAVALGATRYALLALDVPVRWLDGVRRPSALFDPSYLASDVGAGLLRSPADLALTGAFALVGAGAVLAYALRHAHSAARGGRRGPVRALAGLAFAGGMAALAAGAFAVAVRQAVLDATIGYADRAGPVVDALLLTVLGGLVLMGAAAACLLAAAAVIAWAGLDGLPHRMLAARGRPADALVAAVVLAGAALAAWVGPFRVALGLAPALGLAALALLLAWRLRGRPERWAWPLTFRGVLAGITGLAIVVFWLMEGPLRERTDARLADAAAAFAGGRDSRVSFAIEQVLAEARADDALRPALLEAVALADSLRRTEGRAPGDSARRVLDGLASSLVGSSLLGSLADVATELRFVSPSGDTLGSFAEAAPPPPAADSLAFDVLRARYQARGEPGFLLRAAPVEARATSRYGLSRYAGIGPLEGLPEDAEGGAAPSVPAEPVAWVYVRVTPRPVRFASETPFPRALAPAGLFGLDDEAVAYAEYTDGVLTRSRGAEAPLRLAPPVRAALDGGARALVRTETIGGQRYRVYYDRLGVDDGPPRDVVAARTPASDVLDALFFLLRLTLAGLAAGGLVYAVGVPLRRRAGLLPAPRTRFRDKVINRFLIVGLASVTLTGVVGRLVIVEQNRQAVEDVLRQRLQRAEALLAAEAPPGTPPEGLLATARPDAIAAALGVDVHLYEGATLRTSSRRQLVRQRLIEPRLPALVYRALFVDGETYAFAEDRVGTYVFTTGYKAVPDAAGRPIGAIAIPTLPEQAAIEAGQARMVAYLFGGLLGLLAVIAALAVVLAGQLTRPFGRLQRGLQAVGEGHDEEPIPVETRDEVGALVETFNTMQAQLAESRRRLAAQERETAWSEMARQVAHEIKNPLMPMKLSVQHLRRVFRRPGEDDPPEAHRFAGQFERTTQMLIDQIESLNRIASDFSSYARMPSRSAERTDLAEVIAEAAALFEGTLEDAPERARLVLELSPPGALVVYADREELRRAFVNLFKNALQAMPPRERPGRIVARTQRVGAHAVAEVQDDGTGIPEGARGRIFQPSFSTKTSGMGLGLAIVRRAVEAAGGTITFETEEGRGTTFTLRLPLAETPPEAPSGAEASAGLAPPPGASLGTAGDGAARPAEATRP